MDVMQCKDHYKVTWSFTYFIGQNYNATLGFVQYKSLYSPVGFFAWIKVTIELQNLARWSFPKSSFCIIHCELLKGFRSVSGGCLLSFIWKMCSETLSYQLHKHLNGSVTYTSNSPANGRWWNSFFRYIVTISYCCNRPLCESSKNDVPIYFCADLNPVFWSRRWKNKAVGLWVNSRRIHSLIINNCCGLSVLVCMLFN